MTSIRLLLIRSSIFLNAILITYLCLSWYSVTPLQRMRDFKSTKESSENTFVDENSNDLFKRHPLGQSPFAFQGESKSNKVKLTPKSSSELLNDNSVVENPVVLSSESGKSEEEKEPLKEIDERESEYQEPPREVQERAGVTELPMVVAPLVEEIPDPPLDSLERKMYSTLRDCPTKPLNQRYTQRGDYWILENYIPAAMNFRCDESITYTTHGDYTFLDNLDPLTSRWQGPVSVAVYAPGNDFKATVNTILYLRNCMAEGVKKYVTFHIFFHMNHIPKEIPTTDELLQRKTACDKDPPKWMNVSTYRQQKKLLYPVNIARNIARGNSITYFNFPSDVELYPSINIIQDFFKMLKKPDVSNTTSPRVYVFPIFEIAEDQNPPETKTELQAMLKTNKAIPFHKYICPKCHAQPKSTEWQKGKVQPGLSVFHVGKRKPPHSKWEPIYIGTEREPIYDERLSWEGKSDKMTQMYILCVRDYEFHILDNAFLVHRPGIKKHWGDISRAKIASQQSALISKKIFPEYKMLFGTKKGCII